MSTPRIALDGFGTDARPQAELAAAVAAAEAELDIDLVGDRERLEAGLRAAIDTRVHAGVERGLLAARVAAHVAIVHASDVIAMDESPSLAVRGRADSSLVVAVDRVRDGRSRALVSAGNSGALLAAGLLRLGRIAGVDRPAISTSFPRVFGPSADADQGGRNLLLDAGANVECRPLNLVQFAVMGAVEAKLELGLERPRVALLSNGGEPGKGTSLVREAHALLVAHPSPDFEFVGAVEPGALFGDSFDVAVTDGWTGNLTLKMAEGAAAVWPTLVREALRGAVIPEPVASALEAVDQRLNPEQHGGAPLVGVDGTLIICHGASTPQALLSALIMAHKLSERGSTSALTEAIATHSAMFEAARATRRK